jgi:hypothetical protein
MGKAFSIELSESDIKEMVSKMGLVKKISRLQAKVRPGFTPIQYCLVIP